MIKSSIEYVHAFIMCISVAGDSAQFWDLALRL